MNRKGISLLEMVFALTLIIFLVSSIAFIYVVSMRGWSNLGHHSDLHEKLHFALERVIRDVRPARAMSVSNQALFFTVSPGVGGTLSYVYYFYNPSDPWPPVFNQSSYDLYRTTSSVGGSFTYGSGELIATGLKPPPTETSITSSGNVATLKLTAFNGTDQLTVQGDVRPRNMS